MHVPSNNHIPFGLRKGRTYSAREVATGLACNCVCPGCGHPLVAKNAGSQRAAHFAHFRSNLQCEHPGETAIHRHAKQLIREKARLMLPTWRGTAQMPNPPVKRDLGGFLHAGRDVAIAGQLSQLQAIEVEKRHGDLQPDVSALDAEGPLWIEIRVAHAVGEAKMAAVQSDGTRMVEIDLSNVSIDEALDPARFEDLVLNDPHNRRWVSFPQASDDWRKSRADLLERVARIDRGYMANSLATTANGVGAAMPVNRVRVESRQEAPPSHAAIDSFVGRSIWHLGFAIGIVREKLAGGYGPIYVVAFEGGQLRSILLRDCASDWGFVEDAQ